MFIGGFIFEIVGVFFKWVVLLIVAFFRKERVKTFKEILQGEKDHDSIERGAYILSNKFLGALILVVICFIITKLGL